MTFYEMLQEAKALGLNPIDVMIANEVDFHLRNFLHVDSKYCSDNYKAIHELCSSKVKEMYLKADNVSIESITRSLFQALSDDYSRQDICSMY